MSDAIDTSNFDSWKRMEEEQFREVAAGEDIRNFPLVHIVEIPNRGYAILGTYRRTLSQCHSG